MLGTIRCRVVLPNSQFPIPYSIVRVTASREHLIAMPPRPPIRCVESPGAQASRLLWRGHPSAALRAGSARAQGRAAPATAGETPALRRPLIFISLGRPRIHDHSRKHPKRGKKPAKPLGFGQATSPCPDEKSTDNSLKMGDQSEYVNENKGQVYNERCQSGNIAENKGSRALKVEMSLRKVCLRPF